MPNSDNPRIISTRDHSNPAGAVVGQEAVTVTRRASRARSSSTAATAVTSAAPRAIRAICQPGMPPTVMTCTGAGALPRRSRRAGARPWRKRRMRRQPMPVGRRPGRADSRRWHCLRCPAWMDGGRPLAGRSGLDSCRGDKRAGQQAPHWQDFRADHRAAVHPLSLATGLSPNRIDARHRAGLLEPGGIVREVIMNGVRGASA